jgi:AcrR family transcriptional regulator
VSAASTKDKILEAAEALFSARGFQGISVREITNRAGANLAAVNYHFGSKAGLMHAIIERQIGPLNEKRILQLTEAESAAQGRPLSLETVLRIFFTEPIQHFCRPNQKFPHLLARLHQEPTPEVVKVVLEIFGPMAERFLAALQLAQPHLSERQLLARAMFMKGAMVQVMADGEQLATALPQGRVSFQDPDFLIDELVDFCTAGFRVTASIDTRLTTYFRG